MPSYVALIHGPGDAADAWPPDAGDADLVLSWSGDTANVHRDLSLLRAPGERGLPPRVADLIDIATAIYIADIAVMRGEREQWPRSIELAVPVRDVALWRGMSATLRRLIYELTRDRFALSFQPAADPPEGTLASAAAPPAPDGDCVSMLSGGLDSLAGAVMLQQTGRHPIYSLHRSGNPAVLTAQKGVLDAVEGHWPGASSARPCVVEPDPRGERALPFPPAEDREPSRRCRSLLFMALALATAHSAGVAEVFMCENGVLTAGLPLAPSRAGSLSTHSTHPMVLKLMNEIAEAAGITARVLNPFVYQTKAELIRDILTPALTVSEIQGTVSCWATGRANRQCGGCVPCLLRRLGMAWAELPPEAWMVDVLGRPGDYMGTEARGNLVDLLRHAEQIDRQSASELLVSQPGLLSLHAAGLEVGEVVAMLKRHAEQTLTVVRERFPRAARLLD